MNVPNTLTWLRILLIPVFVLSFYLPFSGTHMLAAAIFALASITDYFDGYLARSLQQSTRFGAFLDPVADKLMVAVALVMLTKMTHFPYLEIAAVIVIGREIVISALREWMAELGQRASVAVSFIGKFKTATQMISIFLLLAFPDMTIIFGFIGYILLCIAVLLTIWSMLVYLRAAWRHLA